MHPLLKYFFIPLILLLSEFSVLAQPPSVPAEPGVVPVHVHTSGLQILGVTHDGMFPQSWYSERVDAQAEDLDTAEYTRSVAIVESALSKYPDSLLSVHLRKVYVMQSLSFFGTSYGGTYAPQTVYLTNKGLAYHYDNIYVERVFHAEFSSILLDQYEALFPEKVWVEANKNGFVYGEGGMLALKSGRSSESFLEEYHTMGFLNEYAQSSVENDVNAFAKNLFCPGTEFWEITDKYEGLRKKRTVLIEFYTSIHPQFDEAYFRSLQNEGE